MYSPLFTNKELDYYGIDYNERLCTYIWSNTTHPTHGKVDCIIEYFAMHRDDMVYIWCIEENANFYAKSYYYHKFERMKCNEAKTLITNELI